jgi:hypothetical protein
MRREPAFVNKILKKKQQDRELELHYEKLSTIQPVTRVDMPHSFRFPLLKSKKKHIEEGN